MQYIHIINDLKQGGTNYSIYRLIKKLDKDAKIISLNSKDYYYDIFKENGNEVYKIGCLGKISDFHRGEDNRVLINLTGVIRFEIKKEILNKKLSVSYTHLTLPTIYSV